MNHDAPVTPAALQAHIAELEQQLKLSDEGVSQLAQRCLELEQQLLTCQTELSMHSAEAENITLTLPQLFYDTGSGFSPRECLIATEDVYNELTHEVSVTFVLPEDARAVRLDPGELACCITDLAISDERISFQSVNGLLLQEDSLLFLDVDPNLSLHCTTGFGAGMKFAVNYHYYPLGRFLHEQPGKSLLRALNDLKLEERRRRAGGRGSIAGQPRRVYAAEPAAADLAGHPARISGFAGNDARQQQLAADRPAAQTAEPSCAVTEPARYSARRSWIMYTSYSTLQRKQLSKQVYTDTQSTYLLVYAPGRHKALQAALQNQLHRKFRLVTRLEDELTPDVAGVLLVSEDVECTPTALTYFAAALREGADLAVCDASFGFDGSTALYLSTRHLPGSSCALVSRALLDKVRAAARGKDSVTELLRLAHAMAQHSRCIPQALLHFRRELCADDVFSAKGRRALILSHELTMTGAPIVLVSAVPVLRSLGFEVVVLGPCG